MENLKAENELLKQQIEELLSMLQVCDEAMSELQVFQDGWEKDINRLERLLHKHGLLEDWRVEELNNQEDDE